MRTRFFELHERKPRGHLVSTLVTGEAIIIFEAFEASEIAPLVGVAIQTAKRKLGMVGFEGIFLGEFC